MEIKNTVNRGFITIATGDDRYYLLAYNLLLSYRKHSSEHLPFVLIADRKNKYTSEFDDVIILDHPTCSFMDKLRLSELLPFDETIFIDSDSLALGDLNYWFDFFMTASDFSAFGVVYDDLKTQKGWFRYDGMKEFKKDIHYIPMFNGGVYYLRKTETCKKAFSIAKYCAEHYEEYSFNMFKKAADEPVLGLGMTVCNCKPVSGGWGTEILFAPDERKLKIDLVNGSAQYPMDGKTVSPRLIHWSNSKTRKALYRFETEKLFYNILNHDNTFSYFLLYKINVRYFILRINDIFVFISRGIRKVRKLAKDSLSGSGGKK